MNIIRLNTAEVDELSEIEKRDGFIAECFNMIIQGKIPLNQINYIFDIEVGKLQANTVIKKIKGDYNFTSNVFKNGKYIGVVEKIVNSVDPFNMVFPKQVKTTQNDPLLATTGELVFITTMGVFYCMNHAKKVSCNNAKRKTNHITNSSEEKIYRKINAYVKREFARKTENRNGGGKPSHEFEVRGHLRHLKSGKQIWVKPYTKCKGRGQKLQHEYVILERNSHESK